jgi:hypothetical protein
VLDGDYPVPPANGAERETLVQRLQAEDGERRARRAKYFERGSPPARLEGESDDDYLRRVQESKRKSEDLA